MWQWLLFRVWISLNLARRLLLQLQQSSFFREMLVSEPCAAAAASEVGSRLAVQSKGGPKGRAVQEDRVWVGRSGSGLPGSKQIHRGPRDRLPT